jgi:hypothetical protein
MSRLPEPIEWLAAGIPLTLLIDVLAPTAPDSAEIFAAEAGDAWWLNGVTHAA